TRPSPTPSPRPPRPSANSNLRPSHERTAASRCGYCLCERPVVRISDHGGHGLGPTRRSRPTEPWTWPVSHRSGRPRTSERHAEAIAFAERAIKLASTLGLPAPARALEAALGQGLSRETAVRYKNFAEDLGRAEGPRARLELARQGAAFTQR